MKKDNTASAFFKTHFQNLILISGFSLGMIQSFSQTPVDSVIGKIDIQKWSSAVARKLTKLENKIILKSERALDRLQRQDEKIYSKLLAGQDSSIARVNLALLQAKYNDLKNKLKNPELVLPNSAKQYLPHLDT